MIASGSSCIIFSLLFTYLRTFIPGIGGPHDQSASMSPHFLRYTHGLHGPSMSISYSFPDIACLESASKTSPRGHFLCLNFRMYKRLFLAVRLAIYTLYKKARSTACNSLTILNSLLLNHQITRPVWRFFLVQYSSCGRWQLMIAHMAR